MADYAKPIGDGGLWIRKTRKGDDYFSWQITFPVNANIPITVSGVGFKNDKKEGKQPDWKLIVNKWENTKARDERPPAHNSEEKQEDEKDSQIPF